MAAIGRVEDAVAIINGDAGTIVTPAGDYGGPGDLRSRRRPQARHRGGLADARMMPLKCLLIWVRLFWSDARGCLVAHRISPVPASLHGSWRGLRFPCLYV